jgi:hypothetical protein
MSNQIDLTDDGDDAISIHEAIDLTKNLRISTTNTRTHSPKHMYQGEPRENLFAQRSEVIDLEVDEPLINKNNTNSNSSEEIKSETPSSPRRPRIITDADKAKASDVWREWINERKRRNDEKGNFFSSHWRYSAAYNCNMVSYTYYTIPSEDREELYKKIVANWVILKDCFGVTNTLNERVSRGKKCILFLDIDIPNHFDTVNDKAHLEYAETKVTKFLTYIQQKITDMFIRCKKSYKCVVLRAATDKGVGYHIYWPEIVMKRGDISQWNALLHGYSLDELKNEHHKDKGNILDLGCVKKGTLRMYLQYKTNKDDGTPLAPYTFWGIFGNDYVNRWGHVPQNWRDQCGLQTLNFRPLYVSNYRAASPETPDKFHLMILKLTALEVDDNREITRINKQSETWQTYTKETTAPAHDTTYNPESEIWDPYKGPVFDGTVLHKIARNHEDSFDRCSLEVTKYINKVCIYVEQENEIYIRTRDVNDEVTYKNFTTEHFFKSNCKFKVRTTDTGKEFQIAKLWFNHYKRRNAEAAVWVPFTVDHPVSIKTPSRYVNTWKPFKWDEDVCRTASFNCDTTIVNKLDKFVQDVICAGNQDKLNFLKAWLKVKVTNPANPPQTAIILKGPQGAGKSTFFLHYIQPFFEEKAVSDDHFIHTLGGAWFGDMYNTALIVFADEFQFDELKDQKLKRFNNVVTGRTRIYKEKNNKEKPITNYMSILFATNDNQVIHVVDKQRRLVLFNVYNKWGEYKIAKNAVKEIVNAAKDNDWLGLKAWWHSVYNLDTKSSKKYNSPPIKCIEDMEEQLGYVGDDVLEFWADRLSAFKPLGVDIDKNYCMKQFNGYTYNGISMAIGSAPDDEAVVWGKEKTEFSNIIKSYSGALARKHVNLKVLEAWTRLIPCEAIYHEYILFCENNYKKFLRQNEFFSKTKSLFTLYNGKTTIKDKEPLIIANHTELVNINRLTERIVNGNVENAYVPYILLPSHYTAMKVLYIKYPQKISMDPDTLISIYDSTHTDPNNIVQTTVSNKRKRDDMDCDEDDTPLVHNKKQKVTPTEESFQKPSKDFVKVVMSPSVVKLPDNITTKEECLGTYTFIEAQRYDEKIFMHYLRCIVLLRLACINGNNKEASKAWCVMEGIYDKDTGFDQRNNKSRWIKYEGSDVQKRIEAPTVPVTSSEDITMTEVSRKNDSVREVEDDRYSSKDSDADEDNDLDNTDYLGTRAGEPEGKGIDLTADDETREDYPDSDFEEK